MDKKKSFNKKIFVITLIVSLIIFIIFIFRILTSDNSLNINGEEIKYDITGQIGDFIGGVIGTLFSAAGFYFLYVTLVEQRESLDSQKKSFEIERFESKFFDLLKLHRENVSDQNYTKFGDKEKELAIGRKVFRIIHKEFEECLKEVLRFYKIYEYDFITNAQKNRLNKIILNNDIQNIAIVDLAIIDIAYTILYYGISIDSDNYLHSRFIKKYDTEFFKKLILYLRLKPKKEFVNEYKTWNIFYKSDLEIMKKIIDDIYSIRFETEKNYHFNHTNFCKNLNLYKYYGGHQHRLGHYFRHLFQTYNFIYKNSEVKTSYFYAKTLRAQLSNYEQSLLFINSISSLGYRWELEPDVDTITNKKIKMISTFHLIKNVPGTRILNFKYLDFYPNVDFEFENN